MNKLITLTAPSSAGKDEILKSALRLIPNLKSVVSDTSRPMRVTEQQGKEYHFISEDLMLDRIKRGEYIETREYNVVGNRKWYYGVHQDEINLEDDVNYICILDFQGLKEMEDYLRRVGKLHCLFSIYIDVNYHTRLTRSLNREGVMSDEQVEEVIRRFRDDIINVEPAREYCDIVLYNNKMDDIINIVKIIQETIN